MQRSKSPQGPMPVYQFIIDTKHNNGCFRTVVDFIG